MGGSGSKKKTVSRQGGEPPVEVVARVLDRYARRGVFRGFSRGPLRQGKASFKMVWHRDRVFDFIFDPRANTMQIPLVLPNIPANSKMYGALKQFIRARYSDELPAHRRIDSRKAQVRPFNRGGKVSLTLGVLRREFEYGTTKLINLVHEIFLVFLVDGNYFEYMVETFDLDPDRM